jgi:signal transduction histidine kinase
MPEPYRSAHDGYMNRYRESGEPRVIGIGREVVGMKCDGTTFPADLAIAETWVGNEQQFVGTLRDISERKDIERLKGEFVSLVSHELRTPLTSIARRAPTGVRFEVTDHGSGIPASFHEQIFAKFAQADAGSTRAVKGTGLGLSISKAIVEQHDGTIGFKTEEGAGTTFFFELPDSKQPSE